jgi:hypothetical protein
MLWWIFLAAAGVSSAILVRHLWRSYSHPYNMLVRQGANMNWVAAGTTRYSDGIRNMRLRREDMLAEVSFKGVNVRLLQPDVERPFKDFVEIEQWLGAKSAAAREPEKLSESPGSSTPRKQVAYFDKIDNLLAAKGAREDYTNLQGWDKEFGVASTRVCALAELANETPVVVATFMLESMEYYHKNRDVALSYLARLESGYRARAENPELAAAMDTEAEAKGEAEELFKSIAADSASAGATYIQRVNDFLRSTGHYDSLVLPTQKQADFMRASANVYIAGYQTESSPKVVGALIADGANKYKASRQFGILFLDKVATNMRKQHLQTPRTGSGSGKAAAGSAKQIGTTRPERTYKSEEQRIEDEAAAYHAALDEAANNALNFLAATGFLPVDRHPEDVQKLYAELLLYLATCNARNETRTDIHPGTWNTFKRGVEVRMLGVRDDGHQRNGVIRTADGGRAYAQFTSTYWHKMDALEAVLSKRGATGLIQHLLDEMGVDSGKSGKFTAFFNTLSNDVASSLVPRIAAFD